MTGPLIVDARMPGYTGAGIARYVRGLLHGANLLAGARITALIARRDHGTWYHDLDPATVRTQRSWVPCHHRLERWLLAASLARHRPDAVLSVDHIAPIALGWRSIVTIHDLAFWRFPETHSPESRAYYAATATSVYRASQVICVSDAIRQELLKTLHVDPDRVQVVYNGVDEQFKPVFDPDRMGRTFGLHNQFVLAVGTVERRKNLTLLLEAMALLNRPDLHVVIAGSKGWGASEVEATIARLGLQPVVHWLGRVSDNDLPVLYGSARALAFPSIYEGFALPPLEAMACGTPVVALNTGPLPEVCGKGSNAAAVLSENEPGAFARALASVVEPSTFRDALIEKGLARSRRFTWQTCAEQTLAIVRRATG